MLAQNVTISDFTTVLCGLTRLLAFSFRLCIVPGTSHFFIWCYLGQGSRRAEVILKGDVKTQQASDWSEVLKPGILKSSSYHQ